MSTGTPKKVTTRLSEKRLSGGLKTADRKSSTLNVDLVNHPPHYKQTKYETIDVLEDITQHYSGPRAYSVACVVKYLYRAPHKGNYLQDLKKAQWYMNRLVSLAENESSR